MKRRTLSLLAITLAVAPLFVRAAPDEAQRALLQRAGEARSKLDAATQAQGAQRERLMREHMEAMRTMMQQATAARPGPSATAAELREWIDEHMKLMDQMMAQMMDGRGMMMMAPHQGAGKMMK